MSAINNNIHDWYQYQLFTIHIGQRGARSGSVGSAFNAFKFQRTQLDSLSELFLYEKMPYNQCKGKSLRDSEKLREVLLCACAHERVNQVRLWYGARAQDRNVVARTFGLRNTLVADEWDQH